MEIRPVTYNDIKPLMCIHKERVAFSDSKLVKYLGAFVDDKIVGCVGWQMIGNNMRYKTDCVLKEYRGNRIYSLLFDERDKQCSSVPCNKVTAFCTPMSVGQYLKKGFIAKRVKNGITFVERMP